MRRSCFALTGLTAFATSAIAPGHWQFVPTLDCAGSVPDAPICILRPVPRRLLGSGDPERPRAWVIVSAASQAGPGHHLQPRPPEDLAIAADLESVQGHRHRCSSTGTASRIALRSGQGITAFWRQSRRSALATKSGIGVARPAGAVDPVKR